MALRCYKLLRLKAFFDKGYGLTHYVFKIIAVFGLTSSMISETMWLIGGYTLFCFILGWSWWKLGLINTENAIQNSFNPLLRKLGKIYKV